MALLHEQDQVVYRQRLANEARGVLDALAPYRLVASPTASLDSRPVYSGYLGRLPTRKITRPCQAATDGDRAS